MNATSTVTNAMRNSSSSITDLTRVSHDATPMVAPGQGAPKGAFADELRCKVVEVYVGGQDVGLRQIYDSLA